MNRSCLARSSPDSTSTTSVLKEQTTGTFSISRTGKLKKLTALTKDAPQESTSAALMISCTALMKILSRRTVMSALCKRYLLSCLLKVKSMMPTMSCGTSNKCLCFRETRRATLCQSPASPSTSPAGTCTRTTFNGETISITLSNIKPTPALAPSRAAKETLPIKAQDSRSTSTKS